MHRLILIIISAFALFASPAHAKDGDPAGWIVTQLSGDARLVHPGLQPVALKTSAKLRPGDMILTGATGRATLTRGSDYIIIAPRSQLRLPAAPQPNGFTRVIQSLGTMLFKVRHTGVPHFAVETPMLAAVVKGTTFTVIVDQDKSAVQVIEGAVQVTATDGGMSRIVEGGKTVFVNHSDPKRLIDADLRSPASTDPSSTTAVRINGTQTPSVAAIASLTGGLVHPGANSPTTSAVSPTSSLAPATATTIAPVTNVVTTVAPVTTGIVDTTVPGVVDTVTDTVTDIVGPTVPGVTDTVTDIVDTTVPDVTDTVIDIVDTVIPDVTDTVTDVVDATVPGVTDTVTDLLGGALGGGNSGSGSVGSGSSSGGNSGSGSGLIGGILGSLFPH